MKLIYALYHCPYLVNQDFLNMFAPSHPEQALKYLRILLFYRKQNI